MNSSATIICGTNRPDAISYYICDLYRQNLLKLGVDASVLNLNQLPTDFAFSALYDNYGKNTEFNVFSETMRNSDKFIFVVPEYNGSFPGVLKTFIDGLDYKRTFNNKKGALVGLAASGHGASMALSHLTDILNFLGLNLLAYKPRLEHIESAFDGEILTNEKYSKMLMKQAELFVNF